MYALKKVIGIKICEQKELLKSRLEVETLISNQNNLVAIENFAVGKYGNNLAHYLKNKAWDEDINGNTKVYLVKDNKTKNVVFSSH